MTEPEIDDLPMDDDFQIEDVPEDAEVGQSRPDEAFTSDGSLPPVEDIPDEKWADI